MSNVYIENIPKTISATEDGDYFVASDASDTDKTGKVLSETVRTYMQTGYQGTAREFNIPEEIFQNISSGLYSGGILTINGGDPTKFDLSAGKGHIVDFAANIYNEISWGASTAETPLSGSGINYVYFNSAGTLSQTNTQPDPEFLRDNIYLGRVITSSGTIIAIQMEPNYVINPTNQLNDLIRALRIFNESGNIVSTNGANVKFDKSAGTLFGLNINYSINPKSPHTKSISAFSPTTFQMITQTADSGTNVTDVDVANYDVAGVITSIGGGANRATNFRVYQFPSGNVGVAYGQVIYSSLADAQQGINTESFVVNPNGIVTGKL